MPNPKHFDGGFLDSAVREPPQRGRSVIGIDQSLTGFGITALDTDSFDYYTWVFKSPGVGVDRLLALDRFLTEILDLVGENRQIGDVVMEGYAYSSTMAHTAGEVGATVKLALYNGRKIQPFVVPPSTLKKYVTGRGKAVSKSEIMLGVYKNWGADFTDDNAADSYALARIAAKSSSNPIQREIIDRIHWGK